MRKYILAILVFIGMLAGLYLANMNKGICPLKTASVDRKIKGIKPDKLINDALRLLKFRKDKDALAIFEKILISQSDSLDALWGKAEVLRRSRDHKQSEEILNKILNKNPKHVSSLISLSYIRYKDDRLNEALTLVKQALEVENLDKENEALAYMMLGTINSLRSSRGWFLSKIIYGTQIKGYFLKAKELAPDLPEVHLGLGAFYLLAPAIAGGDLDKAIQELELAVKIAPEFATTNARLAQAYKKKGDLEKYNFYLQRAKELDPENEVLVELR